MFRRQIKLSVLVMFLVAAPLCSAPCNAQVQQAVDRALGDSEGTVVVLDVASGKVLAGKNLNLAAHDLVRPGSTLKPLVLAALLQAGRIDPNQKLVCKRPLRIGSARVDCSHALEITQLNTDDAIAYSCNSYVAQVSLRLTDRELTDALRRAGLDSPTGLIKDEAVGHVERARTQELLQLTALGLRGIEVTPLELLEAYRKLALRRVEQGEGATREVYQGLEHAVSYGTARAASVDGMRVAGKTGTATSVRGSRTHGLFIGYAPADRPEIAVVVYLDNRRGLDAAAVAQPVFAEYWRQKKP